MLTNAMGEGNSDPDQTEANWQVARARPLRPQFLETLVGASDHQSYDYSVGPNVGYDVGVGTGAGVGDSDGTGVGGAAVGPPVGPAVGVTPGLVAGAAKTELGRLTDITRGATQVALAISRLVTPSSRFATPSISCTRRRAASAALSAA
jgi:hypothetical protein